MNNLIFFMALGGTIPFGIYLLLRYKFHQHYKYPTWMYRLLKLSVFFYLFPVPLFSNEIKDFLRFLLNNNSLFLSEYTENVEFSLDMGKYFQKLPDGSIALPQYEMLFIIGGTIWFCITVGLFIKYYRNYRIQRKRILINSGQPSSELLEQCKNIQEKLSLKRPIKIHVMDGEFTPFTLGVVKPIVVFPTQYPAKDIHLVLMHEYLHIKKCDALIQVLGNIVIIIHWYLPFSYLLFRELNSMAELDCDYRVSSSLNEQQIKLYGNLIINSNVVRPKATDAKSPFISNFSNLSENMTKERLIMLKNCKKKKTSVLLVFMLLATFSSTVSAAGYQKPTVIDSTDNHVSKNLSFIAGDSISELPEDEILFSDVNSYFISYNGTVIVLDSLSSAEFRSCSHSFVAGTAKEHVLHANGSCTIYEYSAKYCTECEYVIKRDNISSHNYKICPH